MAGHLSDREKQQRNRHIAAAINSGLTIRQTAEKLGLSFQIVWRTCRELGLASRPSSRGGSPAMTYRILALLMNTPATQSQIAEELGVTVQRVNQVAIAARRAGIRLHPERKFHRTPRTGS